MNEARGQIRVMLATGLLAFNVGVQAISDRLQGSAFEFLTSASSVVMFTSGASFLYFVYLILFAFELCHNQEELYRSRINSARVIVFDIATAMMVLIFLYSCCLYAGFFILNLFLTTNILGGLGHSIASALLEISTLLFGVYVVRWPLIGLVSFLRETFSKKKK